jgi:hypothetical protein
VIQMVEHAPKEGPYAIGTALEAAAGLPVRVCRTWAGERVPETDDIQNCAARPA